MEKYCINVSRYTFIMIAMTVGNESNISLDKHSEHSEPCFQTLIVKIRNFMTRYAYFSFEV